MTQPMVWKYTRGEWEEIVDPMDRTDAQDFDDCLTRNGYSARVSARFGLEEGASIQLYTRNDDERYPVYLLVSVDGGQLEHVYVYDFPSLMIFLRDFAPMFALDCIAAHFEEANQTLERAFQAWHGHDPGGFCQHCDPLAYRAEQERRRKHLSTFPPPRR